jgi:hypothetical protein
VSSYHLIRLNRQAYIDSTAKISDEKTRRFSKMSLQWWDSHFFWGRYGCMVLADERENHLCYVFYKIDRYRQYLSIHNIFTPLIMRRKGYAHELLKMVFEIAVLEKVGRFKLTSISTSLDFYLSLGFIYWGINSVGDYYCDLPVPAKGLGGMQVMTETFSTEALIGTSLANIFKKVKDGDEQLSSTQSRLYEQDKHKMKRGYRFTELSHCYDENSNGKCI